MDSTLERFRIIGLHGYKTIDVAIYDNTLVLVGENGSGKTTFLRILFHFLSGRWLSLVQFRFDAIVATICGAEYRVSHEEIAKAFKGIDRRILAEVPRPLRRRVLELMEKGELDRASLELKRMSGGRYSIPPEIVFRQFQLEFFEDGPKGLKKELQEAIAKIQRAIQAQGVAQK